MRNTSPAQMEYSTRQKNIKKLFGSATTGSNELVASNTHVDTTTLCREKSSTKKR